MKKLEIGDEVIIKRNVNRSAYADISYPDSMVSCMGDVSTIRIIQPTNWHPCGYRYYLENGWCYVEEWIVPLSEATIDDLLAHTKSKQI